MAMASVDFATMPKAYVPRINKTYIPYIVRDTQRSIYTQGNLELAQETRKKERMKNGHFLNIWFWHVQWI